MSGQKPYDPEDLIGRTLAGRYEIEKCIGQGGMGVVYLARQRALDRNVVIKVLSRAVGDDAEASGRFEREAVGMSRLDHPNVVSIYDFGHEDDQAYICMEFVDGETLSRRIGNGGAMSLETFLPIASQLLQGIGEAHSLGLVHRDVKPSNIMLTQRHGQRDYVKILDFGLAKLLNGARSVTKEQSLVGSTAFLSPEQIMGNEIDQRVDVYALGVLFFYMLTAQKPFTADDDITVLYQHVHHAPPSLNDLLPPGHDVPAELIALIERMLAKEPDERPDDAGSIHSELVEIMAGTSFEIGWEPAGGAGLSSISSVTGPLPSPAGLSAAGAQGSSASFSQPTGQSFVTGEQLIEIQKASTRRTIVAVVAALLVAGAGFAAYLMTQQQPPAHQVELGGSQDNKEASSDGPPPVEQTPPAEPALEEELTRADEDEEAREEHVSANTAEEEGEADEESKQAAKPAPGRADRRTDRRTGKPAPKPKSPAKPAEKTPVKKASKTTRPAESRDDKLLLPIDEQPAQQSNEQPSNDDIELLPFE